MSMSTFTRYTGVCSMITGILFLSLAIWYNTSLGGFGAFVNLAGMALLPIGLVGIYLRQREAVGVWGFIILVLAIIGTVLWAGFGWASAFVVPVLEELAPEILKDSPPGMIGTGLMISLVTFFLPLFLFALMTAWKGILPRVAAILLVLVPILDFIPFGNYVAQPLAGVSLLWLGYSVWKSDYAVENG